MIINKESLYESFRVYDNETIVEIIDIFFEEYPDRKDLIRKAIDEYDSELLRTTAHGLKGVISHFHAEEPRILALKLEEKGANKDFDQVEEINYQLFQSLEIFIDELNEIREYYSA